MNAGFPQVECRSEWVYAERPTAVYWSGERLEVTRVDQEWLSPDGRHFRLTCGEDQRFELVYLEDQDSWLVTPV